MQEPKSDIAKLTREDFNKDLLDNFPQGAHFGWFKREDLYAFWKSLKKSQLEEEQALADRCMIGRWHHGNGILCCGTIRVAVADWDTSPPKNVQDDHFELICQVMNKANEFIKV